jgi:N-acetylglucosaminyl-diphospho-decaprenol L-rhamnosyltransferase
MISAVVVTYDSEGCIGRCLSSIRRALPDAEIVVVDNGSRDDTVRVALAAAPEARVVQAGDNVGFGRACNLGAGAATRSHILFLNPDVTLAAADADSLGRLLERRPFGLVAPTLDGESDRRRAEEPWAADLLAHTLETLRPREAARARIRHPVGPDAPAWVGGAILLAAREEFDRLGGFDPRFFLYYEDRDLSRRYRQAGLPIGTTDALRGFHAGGESSAHDGLRVGPNAWALLGWLQYISINDGDRTARRAARLALLTLRAVRVVLRAPAAAGWPRAQRKARQVDELLRFVHDRARSGDGSFCPDAMRAVRGLA